MSNLPRSDTWREGGGDNQHHRWALPVPAYSPKLTLPPNLYCYLQSLDTARVTRVRSTDCNYHHHLFFFLIHFLCFQKCRVGYSPNAGGTRGATTGKAGLAWLLSYTTCPVGYTGPQGKRKAGDRGFGPNDIDGSPTRRALVLAGVGVGVPSSFACMLECVACRSLLVLHERWKAPERDLFFRIWSSGFDDCKSLDLHRIRALVCGLPIRGRRRGPRTG
ncbi:hypothetical protein CGRA01v4_12908 [Colletotrichum graminicola]|nr:hypothetical protein CGRA01v4_12908 [Colletotrichum graminicola]